MTLTHYLLGTAPQQVEFQVMQKEMGKFSKCWLMSPDYASADPVELQIQNDPDSIRVCIPEIEYWALLVFQSE